MKVSPGKAELLSAVTAHVLSAILHQPSPAPRASCLLCMQALLREAEAVVPEGEYAQLTAIIVRIEGSPNNLQVQCGSSTFPSYTLLNRPVRGPLDDH